MKDFLSDAQVELEIERLLESEEVKLAKAEQRIKNRRRQYLYSLRTMEKRGQQLMSDGITMENIVSRLFPESEEDGIC
jgi:hypothetical protein